MKRRYYVFFLGILLLCAHLQAEEAVPDASAAPSGLSIKRARGFFGTLNYLLNDLDTNYVSPNHYNFTIMLENSIWHENYRISSDERALSFTPDVSYKLGPYVGWSFIFLGWTVDMEALFNKSQSNKRTEFSLNIYNSIIGGDLFF